jgi:hypothetical protein
MLFVSYSRQDAGMLDSLSGRLSALGIEYWLDTAQIPVGEAFVARIGHALRQCQDFLLVDTQASRQSYWVGREVRTALFRRRTGYLSWIARAQFGSVDTDSGLAYDVAVDGTNNWTGIESLLSSPPAQKVSGEHNIQTLEALVPGGDIGQPEHWTGRQEELQRLDDWWISDLPLAWVEGPPGMGKSGLIRTWIAAFNELGYESGDTCAAGYISGLHLERGSTEFKNWLAAHPEPRLLMIDGYDEVRHAHDALTFTLRAMAANVRILVSSRSPVPSQLASNATTLSLAGLSRSLGEELLRPVGLSKEASATLLQQYGDSPLMLSIATRALRDGTVTVEDLLNTEQDGLALSQLLRRSVTRLSPDAQRLLEGLAVGPRLRDVFQAPESDASRSALDELVKAGLVTTGTQGDEGPTIVHEAIRKWVLDNLQESQTD